jgi:hypothetical protein
METNMKTNYTLFNNPIANGIFEIFDIFNKGVVMAALVLLLGCLVVLCLGVSLSSGTTGKHPCATGVREATIADGNARR